MFQATTEGFGQGCKAIYMHCFYKAWDTYKHLPVYNMLNANTKGKEGIYLFLDMHNTRNHALLVYACFRQGGSICSTPLN